jgi:hypothetical protein
MTYYEQVGHGVVPVGSEPVIAPPLLSFQGEDHRLVGAAQ